MQEEIDVDVHPRYPMSWRASAFNGLLRGTTKPMSAILLRHSVGMSVVARIAALGERLPLPAPSEVQIARADDSGSEWIRAGRRLDEGKVVLYFHGGGYFFCSPATHRPITWRLSAAARRPVFALDYRQGPVHSLAESLADALDAYQCLIDRGYAPSDIVLAGDSAGGHLTLATLLALRDQGRPLPASAICISPWADLSEARRRVNRWADPILSARRVDWLARRWTAGLDRRDPLVSPVFGDYTGLPPLMVVTGSTEVLRDEGRRVALQARRGGVKVTYEEWHRMPHVFPILADVVPEARLVFRHIERFLLAVTARTGSLDPAGAAGPAPHDSQACDPAAPDPIGVAGPAPAAADGSAPAHGRGPEPGSTAVEPAAPAGPSPDSAAA